MNLNEPKGENQLDVRVMPEKDYLAFARLSQRAYPKSYSGVSEELEQIASIYLEIGKDPDIVPYGAYLGDKLVGGLLYYRFDYNFHGNSLVSTGIGTLAVDLLHKKEKVAKRLIEHTMEVARGDGSPLFMLYPFKTAFYKNFGFGMGSTVYHYCTAPLCFKDFGNKHLLIELEREAFGNISDWVDMRSRQVQGMTRTTALDRRRLLKNGKASAFAAYEEGQMTGYVVFEQSAFGSDHIGEQKIQVIDMMWENRKALQSISSFFNSQADQVAQIEWHTYQPDLQWILKDLYFEGGAKFRPLSGHKFAEASKGLMYQALNVEALLMLLEKRFVQKINFIVTSPDGSIRVHKMGQNQSESTLEIKLDLAEFSSFIVGAVSLESLYEYGTLETQNPERLKWIDRELQLEKPQCYTRY